MPRQRSYERPQIELPESWNVDLETAAAQVDLTWWNQFNDPVLDDLIATALAENKDLRIAAAVIDEYAGRLGVTRSELYPQVGLGLEVGRGQRSLETARPQAVNEERINSRFVALANVSWEADLWGRLASANEASLAELLAAGENSRALVLSLVSTVAIGYLDILSLDRQLEITRATVAFRAEWLERFERKGGGGQVSGLEVAQVRHAYLEAVSDIPRIELQIARRENALSVLIGGNPGRIPRGGALEALGMLAVPAGLPADLLARRPDIREQEQRLIAAHARVNEVRAKYYPNILLTGSLGFSSKDISDWIQESASLWDLGVSAIQPLFDWGRIEGEEQEAMARSEQALQGYLKAIQVALLEVEDALISIQKQRELMEFQALHVATLEEYATLARGRFDASLPGSSYLAVLDAERNLYDTKIARTETLKALYSSLVTSYKAMGGGWESATPAAETPTEE